MNKWAPDKKVLAAGGIGVPTAILIAWILNLNGVTMPGEAQAALGSIISTLVGYFVPSGPKQ